MRLLRSDGLGDQAGGRRVVRLRPVADRPEKQRQLDEVNRRLRAGYTPVQGERLRQRRRDYEAYLRRFCEG